MNPTAIVTRPRALLFDMDGTLTKPLLDFPRIKAEMAIGASPILEAMGEMDPARRSECERILSRHEERAARESTSNAGCDELLEWVHRVGVRSAVVTRNSLASTRIVFERHRFDFEVCITREDGLFKPDPGPLLLACQRLNMRTEEAWMIGDGSHDIEAATAAGMKSAWISHGSTRSFAAEPWREVPDLIELLRMLRETSDASTLRDGIR